MQQNASNWNQQGLQRLYWASLNIPFKKVSLNSYPTYTIQKKIPHQTTWVNLLELWIKCTTNEIKKIIMLGMNTFMASSTQCPQKGQSIDMVR